MDKPEFYQRLAEILDVEEVKPEDVLKEFDGWDSLAILSVLAMAVAKYGVSIKAEEIRSVVSAQNLANLVEAKHKPE
jgi:acyl carrier protein